MTKTVAIIQARLGSTRLPGKVLYELAGRPMIRLLVERVQRTPGLDAIVLATGVGAANDALAQIAADLGIGICRGPEEDVLARFAQAAACNADYIVRLTGDCPLADPEVIASVLKKLKSENLDYCTNVLPPTWPDGLDVSVFTRDTLERAHRQATLPSQREHVVTWMWANSQFENGSILKAANVRCPEDLSDQRWTVDDPADYVMMRKLVEYLGNDGVTHAGWQDILRVFREHPEIAAINATGIRDAGLALSRASDPKSPAGIPHG